MSIGKIFVLCVFCFLSNIAFGQSKAGTTVYNYYSEEVDSPAWVKDVITADGENYTHLNDRQGALAQRQSVVAVSVAVENLYQVGESYRQGFESGIEHLTEATNNIPKDGLTIAIQLPLIPNSQRTAIEGFIVSNGYDSVTKTDVYLIHFTQSLAVQPSISFPYVSDGGLTTNYVTGTCRDSNYPGSSWDNVYTSKLASVTYDNCHLFYVPRPESIQNLTVYTQPMIKWGGSGGIDYGTIVHLAFGERLFNGTLRDFNNAKYAVVKDGAILEPGWVSYEEGTLPTLTGTPSSPITRDTTLTITGNGLGGATVELFYKEAGSGDSIYGGGEAMKITTASETEIQFRASSDLIPSGTGTVKNYDFIFVIGTPYGATYFTSTASWD